jgi:hypothetical protein
MCPNNRVNNNDASCFLWLLKIAANLFKKVGRNVLDFITWLKYWVIR